MNSNVFLDYLQFGPEFTVYTDNNPLTYILTSVKVNALGASWIKELAEFNFVIKYKLGRENLDADGLSRHTLSIADLKEL